MTNLFDLDKVDEDIIVNRVLVRLHRELDSKVPKSETPSQLQSVSGAKSEQNKSEIKSADKDERGNHSQDENNMFSSAFPDSDYPISERHDLNHLREVTGKAGKLKVFRIILLLLVLACICGGVYYWSVYF